MQVGTIMHPINHPLRGEGHTLAAYRNNHQ